LEKTTSVNTLLPRIQNGFTAQSIGWDSRPTVAVTPLPFWFCRGDPGVALPIDAINNDQVRVNITFAPITSLYVSSAQVAWNEGSTAAGGEAYFPLLGSSFFQSGQQMSVNGLTGNPSVATNVSLIPGITMESSYQLGDTYLLAEYVYLDKPEANKFRISDIQYPITQHYIFEPSDTKGLPRINIPLRIPNPTRDLFFFAQRYEAQAYNAPFLSSRDLSGLGVNIAPWWPDAQGLNAVNLGTLIPAFATRQSEPIDSLALVYENKLYRYNNLAPQLFRSLLPSIVQKKTPWVNGYYYNLPFGMDHGIMPPSVPTGEANLDKVEKVELRLQMKPLLGSIDPNNVPRFIVYCFAETYNILRIYGGRAGLLFAF
jgi:hypothetical protein